MRREVWLSDERGNLVFSIDENGTTVDERPGASRAVVAPTIKASSLPVKGTTAAGSAVAVPKQVQAKPLVKGVPPARTLEHHVVPGATGKAGAPAQAQPKEHNVVPGTTVKAGAPAQAQPLVKGVPPARTLEHINVVPGTTVKAAGPSIVKAGVPARDRETGALVNKAGAPGKPAGAPPAKVAAVPTRDSPPPPPARKAPAPKRGVPVGGPDVKGGWRFVDGTPVFPS